jgi:hypothetical protein
MPIELDADTRAGTATTIDATTIWRRLDSPGHDSCRLCSSSFSHRIDGGAAFLHEGEAAWLSYAVVCDAEWQTRSARVQGWIGDRCADLTIDHTDEGIWKLNGKDVPEICRNCDIDLGFTPATNIIAVRRLALLVGREAEATAAWLDPTDWRLKTLPHRYRRDTEDQYRYEAPTLGFVTTLTVTRSGLVRNYPPLWESEK